MSAESKKGMSVILCCYNSSRRIKETLEALAQQEFSSPVSWEIILVDNASTDQTAVISRSLWDGLHSTIDFRIVHEASPGLANARNKGISKASYSYLLFCDDDNWLAKDYVQIAFDTLHNNPDVAACGGMGIPVFETGKPSWFDEYAEAFALGSQDTNSENGKILNLYGAGLCVKREMIDKLKELEFSPLMQGRVGKQLSSSEDTELTYALVLMGYKLHYNPDLRFSHYLTKERLTISYLKKLFIAFGNDGPVRNLYYAMISSRYFHRKIRNWHFHMLLSLFRLVKYTIVPPKKNGRVIYLNWSLAYIKELLMLRDDYSDLRENILRLKNKTAAIHHSP